MKYSIDNILPVFLIDKRYRILRHILLQLLIVIITVNIFWDTPDHLILNQERFYAWLIYYFIINLLTYASIYILVPRFLLKDKYFLYIISSIILIFFSISLIMILQGVLFEPTISGRPQPEVTEQNSAFLNFVMFFGAISSVFGIGLVIAGISTILLLRNWIEQDQRIGQLESATLQSELDFLKSQINPHFLFNMLNNANIMLDEDPEMASGILIKLDDLLRYQFNDSTREKVYLNADINFLTDFLDLEKTRRDNFNYILSKEGNINNVQIPPLLFIPFVENAVKHNTDSNNESYIHLTFNVSNGKLTFTCENSKPLNPVKKKVGGLGLTNIKRRLDLLFQNNYLFKIDESERKYSVYLQIKLD